MTPHTLTKPHVALVTKGFAMSNNDYCLPPLIDLVRSLANDVSIDVYALNYPYERRRYDLFGARVHAFGLGRVSSVAAKFLLRRRVMQEHARKPYDLIHAVWADHPATLAADIAAHLRRPLVTTLYAGEAVWLPRIGYGSLGQARRRDALGRVLAHSDTVVAGSSTLARTVQDLFDRAVTTIPLGLDPARFGPDGPRDELGPGRHVVTAASFSPVKGLDRLVSALGALAEGAPRLLADTTWHIVGPNPRDDALRRALNNRIGALPLRLHDARPHWEMAALYRAADLACVPSFHESQCFAAIEAAACGAPVMGTAVGILPDMVSPGWLCPAQDDAALAEVIARVLGDPLGWTAEVARQQAWISGNATLDIARDRYLAVYRQARQGGIET